MKLEDELRYLLRAIRLIQEKHGENDAPESKIKVPSTAPLSFVDFLLEKLTEQTSPEAKTIQVGLVSLKSMLEEITESHPEQEELQTFWTRSLELAYKIERLVDYLVVGDLSDSFLASFGYIMEDMKNLKLEFELEKPKIEKTGVAMTRSCRVVSRKSFSYRNEVVGYLEEAESIKNRLTRGSKQLQVVPIVGMPGQGKTALALKVYNDPSISYHFSVCAWATVSQTGDVKRVLLDLLTQIDPNQCSVITCDRDLVEKVGHSLKGKRYLIFLDDIWQTEAWRSFKEAFPEDHSASRIMLTSRRRDVAPGEEPHELRSLTDEESMDLLGKKLFGSCWPSELIDIGTQIVQICKGLPLTILIVAGILVNTEPHRWEAILGGLNSAIVSSVEQCKKTLELSYNNLPEHLRPCFLYFARFPEDHMVSVRRLLRLWIAEGFVRRSETNHIDNDAEDYLKDLIDRSLIMVARQNPLGQMKTCHIHDLFHEFCSQKAKDELFLSVVRGNSKLLASHHQPQNLRRLCIKVNPMHLRGSVSFLSYARSVNFNYDAKEPQNFSFMFQTLKLLRVLDLGRINLGHVFPSEIGLLVQLAFLEIRGYMRDIPPLIANLTNLETFILNQIRKGKVISLPDSIWKLQKLRHLSLPTPGGSFPMESLATLSNFCELGYLSVLAIPYPTSMNMEGLLKMFPNVRELKFTIFTSSEDIGDHVKIVVPQSLSQLDSLGISLRVGRQSEPKMFEFSLPRKLKRLTMSGFYLCCKSLSTFSKLPNLEVLKLDAVHFEGNTWEMEEDEFSKLRYLQLNSWELHSWNATEEQFHCLEKLELRACTSLKEMPSCLEDISTLEEIKIIMCSDAAVELVDKIKEVQTESGNSELKIITSISN
ncbi:OLC1v1036347C1 [Oldenlandia corymbosa var. corymbosa]|uniref:OLC1v1036347C1 n=1 Tax=Oldenlandia corymbosa var. corymbosa TaxID=529605 RepID=A0AAV1CX12_OLDCO|nr:OLC1v1036347C1 [Oldenlandia corymbosa var. corymbosa]